MVVEVLTSYKALSGLLTQKKGESGLLSTAVGVGGPGAPTWSQLTLKGGRAEAGAYRLGRDSLLGFLWHQPRKRIGGAWSSCNNVAKMQVPAFHLSFTVSVGMGSQFFLWCLE